MKVKKKTLVQKWKSAKLTKWCDDAASVLVQVPSDESAMEEEVPMDHG